MTGLQKQPISIPFGRGLNTKADPKQIQPGNFTSLVNAIFTNDGLLQKRNGFAPLPPTNDTELNTISTLNGSLVAVGNSLNAYSQSLGNWTNQGSIAALTTKAASLSRIAGSQGLQDTAIDSSGLTCTVFTAVDTSGLLRNSWYYQITDNTTGQVLVAPTLIAQSGGGGVTASTTNYARVFSVGGYFIIVYNQRNNGASPGFLAYTTIAKRTFASSGLLTIQTFTSPLTNDTATFDGAVTSDGNTLYLAWATASALRTATIDYGGNLSAFTDIATTNIRSCLSVTIDSTGALPVIWISGSPVALTSVYTYAMNQALVQLLVPTKIFDNTLSTEGLTWNTATSVTSTAQNGVVTVLLSALDAASNDLTLIRNLPISGSGGLNYIFQYGVRAASKAFLYNSTTYVLTAYGVDGTHASFEPTYFLIKQGPVTADVTAGNAGIGSIVAKLAQSNCGILSGTPSPGEPILPGAYVLNNTIQIAYLIKDQVAPVNRTQGIANPAGIYTQSGTNLATWTINQSPMQAAEAASTLHLSGGMLWMYDGESPVEHNFHIFPENFTATAQGGGGSMTAQQYYYQVTYEWTDAQGNIHRSAPSVPVGVNVGSGGNSVRLVINNLWLTAKPLTNLVRVVIYRWSTAQETYYQVTNVANPLTSTPLTPQVAFTDTQADGSIVGNQILYTNGGVVENIAAPAFSHMTLYRGRLFGIAAESRNTLWYSKPLAPATPVEFSDLFTLFVPPSIAGQGSTGECQALAPMDDKLIIYKANAAYYLVGNGPDITGANNDYSDPIFIGSTAGTSLPASVIIAPTGHFFQSDKGIWQLTRSLEFNYAGAAAEAYVTSTAVNSAVMVPGTTQLRFTQATGATVMYDYYYGQWGQFSNNLIKTSCIYGELQAYIDTKGNVCIETPGLYLDDSRPVTMSFTTGWIHAAGLQGYQRAYYFYLLGQYISPHRLSLSIAYDYGNISQVVPPITPTNYAPPYGTQAGPYGSSNYGGPTTSEDWRVFFAKQKCQAFQLSLQEIYDPSLGAAAGAGFNLSGLNFVIGAKKGYRPTSAAHSTG